MGIDLLVQRANAVQVGVDPAGGTSGGSYDWGTYISAILKFSQEVGATLVVLLVIYAGFVYVTSRGDSARLTAAKDRIVGALLGYIILLLASTIYAFLKTK